MCGVLARARCGCRLHSCQAEIENLHRTVVGKKNVLRFQIAVNDALGVSGRQPIGNRDADFNSFAPGNWRPAKLLTKCFAFQQFRNHVRDIVILADVVDR